MPMNEIPQEKLCEIIKKYGQQVCEDPQRFEGLIKDFCGEYRKEVASLIGASKEGVPIDLLKLGKSLPIEVLMAQLVTRLEDNLGLSYELAKWAVESWSLALDLIAKSDLSSSSSSSVANTQSVKYPPTYNLPSQTTSVIPNSSNTTYIQLSRKSQEWVVPSVIGVFVGLTALFAILYFGKQENQQYVSSSPSASPSYIPTATPSYNSTPETSLTTSPNANPSDTPSPTNTNSIPLYQAVDLIRRWLVAKGELLSPPYNIEPASQVLTGKAYQCNISRQDGQESSVDWLRNNGASWEFTSQNVDKVLAFTSNQDQATITVAITEKGVLRNKNGEIDSDNSYFKQRNQTYNLQLVEGQWKISYYKLPGCD